MRSRETRLVQKVAGIGELLRWQEVPELVKSGMAKAAPVARKVRRLTRMLPALSEGYGIVYWHPGTKRMWVVASDEDKDDVVDAWQRCLGAIPDVESVRVARERLPDDRQDWIRIKTAGALSWLGKPYQWAGKPFGGPTVLSNMIVSGLLGGGLGYGASRVLEFLFPERFINPRRLRKVLTIMGAGGGAALHLPQLFANMQMNREATGRSHFLRSLLAPTSKQQVSPGRVARDRLSSGGRPGRREPVPPPNPRSEAQRRSVTTSPFKLAGVEVPIPEETAAAIAHLEKQAMLDTGMQTALYEPIPVDQFNRAIWSDASPTGEVVEVSRQGVRVRPGTPAPVAGAVSGLVTGIQQMHGGSSILSPAHFIRGLAAAGVDTATANVAGRALGALGLVSPQAREQLQNMGAWAGMMRGIASSVFGQ